MTSIAECDPGVEVPDKLFKDVKYFVVGTVPSNVTTLLNKGHAKQELYLTDMVTHAIAEDDTEYNFSEVKDLFEIPVVTSQWVVLSIKCGCLLPNGFSPDSVEIFDGVVACPSQLSSHDSSTIWALLKYHGGRCKTRLDASVTHLITSEDHGAKYLEAVQHGDDIKVVTPDWVSDSVQERGRLEESRYHPCLLMTGEEIEASHQLAQLQADQIKQELDQYGLPMSPPPNTPTVSTNLIFKSESTRTKEALARLVSNRMIHQGGSLRPVLDPALLMRNQMDFAPPLDAYSPPPILSPPALPQLPTFSRPDTPPRAPGSPRGGGSPRGIGSPRGMGSPRGTMGSPRGVGSPRGMGSPRGLGSPHHGMGSPPGMGSPHGMGSLRGTMPPRGPRSPRVRGTGSPRGGARGQLRNITNNTDGRPPRSPRGSGRGRGGRGANKISNLMSHMNRQFPPFFQGPLPPHLQYGPGGIPTPASMGVYYGHDPSESVPPPLCMLGCVFYVTDYHKYLEAQEIENWKLVIEQNGGQVDDSYSNRVSHVLCEHQKSDVFQLALRDGKRVVTAHWLNDCLVMKKMQPPWLVLHFPSPYGTDRPCKNQIITVSNFDGEERMRVKHMITVTGAKYTGYLTRSNSVLIAKRPEGEKYRKACEWRIPVVNVQWLNNLLLGDMMALKLPLHIKYQHFADEDCFRIAEKWRVGHMLEGWKIPIKVSKEAWKRFNPSQFLKPAPPGGHPDPALTPGGHPIPQTEGATEDGGQKRKSDCGDSDGLPPEKRQRLEDGSGVLAEQHLNGVDAPIVLITGIRKHKIDSLVKNVKRLGGTVTEHPDRCTHLLVNCIARTMKFFMALTVAKYVITPEWITQSGKAGKFLDESDFLLRDEKAETQFNFNLQESLRRMREKNIFQDLLFYVTPSVKPTKRQLKDILDCCGSKIIDHRPSVRTIANSKTTKGKPAIIVISCENDMHLLLDLKKRNIGIHNAEFILTGLIRQEIDYNAYRYDF